MTDRERLIELIRKAKKNTKGASCDLEREMLFADYLLENGVIVPPCKVGDTVYMLLPGDLEFYISEEKVTEVCSKGFYISDFFPPKDDMGSYISYEQIGKTVFLTWEEADRGLNNE